MPWGQIYYKGIVFSTKPGLVEKIIAKPMV